MIVFVKSDTRSPDPVIYSCMADAREDLRTRGLYFYTRMYEHGEELVVKALIDHSRQGNLYDCDVWACTPSCA